MSKDLPSNNTGYANSQMNISAHEKESEKEVSYDFKKDDGKEKSAGAQKEQSEKKEKSPLDNFLQGVRDKIDASQGGAKEIVQVLIKVKVSDMQAGAKQGKDPAAIKAMQTTTYADGTTEEEEVEVPMSQQDIQDVMGQVENSKKQGVGDMLKDAIAGLMGSDIDDMEDVKDGEQPHSNAPDLEDKQKSKSKAR